MRKQLRILAGLALASVVVFAFAQIEVVGREGERGTASAGSRQAMATLADGAPQNAAIRAMRGCIVSEINVYRHEALSAGRDDIAGRLIEVSCWSVLAGMTPAQQRHEIDRVWRLGEFKPNGEWNHVTAAPSMVKLLLDVPKKTEVAIEAIVRAGVVRRMAPYDAFGERMKREAAAKGVDVARIYNEELRKFHFQLAAETLRKEGKSAQIPNHDAALAVLARRTCEEQRADIAQIRALLTSGQRAEWDRIEKATLEKTATAAKGGNPFAR